MENLALIYHPVQFESIRAHLEVLMAMRSVTNQKMAFGLSELSSATGLSVGLLRKEVKRGALLVRRVGRRVVVLREDWLTYLEHEGGATEKAKEPAQKRTPCL
jgi:hypothetical protein